jgi:hypothetical protein
MIATLVASMALFVPAQTVDLNRVFSKGEKQTYSVEASLLIESRQGNLKTFLPEDYGVEYKFTTEVTELKADGICEMRYKRPTMTEISGETPESPPKRKVTPIKMDAVLTVSPINEILNFKDMNPPKTPPKKGGGLLAMGTLPIAPVAQIPSQFQQEIFRLALFLGSMDSSLDLSPKLPLDEVKVGETWKKTVGYSPQVLKGKDGKSAVQRLDYTYTYRGIVDSDAGQKVHRVTADLKLDSDIAPFMNDLMGLKPEESGLKSMKLKLDATITFDLDLKTRRTLLAVAESNGGMSVVLTQQPNEPFAEIRLKGRTTMQPGG